MTGVRSLTLLKHLVPNTEMSRNLPDGLSYFILHRKRQKKNPTPNSIQEEEGDSYKEWTNVHRSFLLHKVKYYYKNSRDYLKVKYYKAK
jgi:hypothetical protein